jgi:hypothetical protein
MMLSPSTTTFVPIVLVLSSETQPSLCYGAGSVGSNMLMASSPPLLPGSVVQLATSRMLPPAVPRSLLPWPLLFSLLAKLMQSAANSSSSDTFVSAPACTQGTVADHVSTYADTTLACPCEDTITVAASSCDGVAAGRVQRAIATARSRPPLITAPPASRTLLPVPRMPLPIAQTDVVMDTRAEAVAVELTCESGTKATHAAVELALVEPSHAVALTAFA